MDVKSEPRVLRLGEIQTTWGHGWLEIVYPPDEEGDAVNELEECVWLRGDVLSQSPEFGYCDHYEQEELARGYGCTDGGMRIWNDRPTEAQRKAVKWG